MCTKNINTQHRKQLNEGTKFYTPIEMLCHDNMNISQVSIQFSSLLAIRCFIILKCIILNLLNSIVYLWTKAQLFYGPHKNELTNET